MTDDLTRLREDIRALDAQMIELAAKRLQLARKAGERKLADGQPLRNYAVEAEVINLARETAQAAGVTPRFAEELVKMLIQESLRAQERDRRDQRREAPGSTGRRALVIGGAGSMGRWFCEFMESKGFGVSVADPRGSGDPHRPLVDDISEAAASFDVIILATPPSAVGPTLRLLAGRTDALIFEIGSLKSPFEKDLRALAEQGATITSVHPMWGPTTDLLADKNVLVCDCGNEDANRAARALFEDTAAQVVNIAVEEHDLMMARTLGMPHAVNLVFGHALADVGEPLPRLAALGGPTFRKQVAASREVASENKDLYYEIQHLNPHTRDALARLRTSLESFESSLASRESFRAYMAHAQRYFEGGPSP